jgi:hypothetical protein
VIGQNFIPQRREKILCSNANGKGREPRITRMARMKKELAMAKMVAHY